MPMDASRFPAAPRQSWWSARAPATSYIWILIPISVNGQRYAVDATRHPVASGGLDVKNSGIGNNTETAKNVGGGALLGTLIGAIVGGAKGAAVGAAAGATVGAGVQVVTHGRRVNVPAETLLTYRLQSGLDLGVKDTGYDRNGQPLSPLQRGVGSGPRDVGRDFSRAKRS